MLLTDIESLLSGTESNIFIGFIPDVPDSVCVISGTGGFAPDRVLSRRLTIEKPTFQVIVRDTDYTTGESRICAAVDLLEAAGGVINGVKYFGIYRLSDVLPLGKDEKGRSQFSVNFNVKFEKIKD